MDNGGYLDMPDTTSGRSSYRRPIRRLIASVSLFISSLLLVASMGLAQPENVVEPEDSGGYPPPSEEDFEDGDTENGNGEDEFAQEIEDDASAPADQYQQEAPETPATGGVALLPLAGSVATAGFGGFMLVRRK